MSETKASRAPSIVADAIGTDNKKNNDILMQAVSEAIKAAYLVLESDSICTCKARVICTNATEDSKPHHMRTEEGMVHMGNIEELNRTNIEPSDNFEGCTKSSDGKCMIAQKYKEWIADQEWKAVDETSSQGEGKEKLNKETSYMVCTEYEGVIYFYDDGQVIKDFLDEENDGDFSEWAWAKRIDKIAYFKTFIEAAKIEQLKWGIPWQLTLSQIAYESGWGEKVPIDIYTEVYSYNLFGIKNLNPESEEDFVRIWTHENINLMTWEAWEKEQERWAQNGEKPIKEEDTGMVKIIQPFRRFDSYEDGIAFHSKVLMGDRYSAAWEYEDNPYIYLAIIAPIYAPPGVEYVKQAGKIMDDYFEWEDKEKDLEEYQSWMQKQNR